MRFASIVSGMLLVGGLARAEPPKTIAVDQIKAGMTGYGLTVFEGVKPDRFNVSVIAVLHDFQPKEDVILVRSDDPRLIHSGIVAGMSGSPVFLHTPAGDRLAGALAFGWHFAKDPIGGVTPIANMLAEAARPLRGRDHTPVAEARRDATPAEAGDRVAAGPSWAGHPLPPALPAAAPRATDPFAGGLVRAAVPLSLAGFGPAAFDEIGRALEPYHVTPLAASGAARPGATGPDHFEPGGSIAVELVRGDMSAVATGTVTWVDGDKVLAFGHPMFNAGEVYLPIATAEIHTFLASISSSFKIASPLREIGTLVQDRQSAIVGDTAHRSDMIPVEIRVRTHGAPAVRAFHAEVVRHRLLTPMLTSMVIANAVQESASDLADATVTLRTAIAVHGEKTLELTEHAFSTEGLSPKVFGSSTGLKAVSELLFNPFQPVHLDRVAVDVDVDYRPDVQEITGLALHTDELEAGTRPSLQVTLRPYNGAEYVQSIPIDIPRALAGQQLKIEAAAGNLVKPEMGAPESLRGLMDNLRKGYPARAIVVTVETPDEDLTLRGAVVADLPGSIADTLRPGASTRRGEAFKRNARIVVPTAGVTVGKQSLQVRVKDLVR